MAFLVTPDPLLRSHACPSSSLPTCAWPPASNSPNLCAQVHFHWIPHSYFRILVTELLKEVKKTFFILALHRDGCSLFSTKSPKHLFQTILLKLPKNSSHSNSLCSDFFSCFREMSRLTVSNVHSYYPSCVCLFLYLFQLLESELFQHPPLDKTLFYLPPHHGLFLFPFLFSSISP